MKTVLVVEDTDDLRELFVEVLESAGYRALGAEHGEKALEILASEEDSPCLILLDMMMPVMDGAAFLARLHETGRIASQPIVVVSATSPGQPIEGVQRIVKKPLSPSSLTRLAEEYCGPP